MTSISRINVKLFNDDAPCLFLASIIVGVFNINLLAGIAGSLDDWTCSILVLFIKIIIVAIFLLNLPILIKRINSYIMYLTLLSLIIVSVNLFFFTENESYFVITVSKFYINCYPSILCASIIKDYNLLLKYLRISSNFIVFELIIILFSLYRGYISFSGGNLTYAMGFGYSCLLPLLALIEKFIKDKNIYDCISIFILSSTILFYGSRMPLLTGVVFFIFLLILHLKESRKYISLCLVLFTMIILICLKHKFIFILENYLSLESSKLFNVSRILYLFARNDLLNLSGREEIYPILWQRISSSPFLIRGINAEYLLFDIYAHNIFIELIYQLGLIIGCLFSFFIIYNIYKSIFYKFDDSNKTVCLIFMFSSVLPLLVSSSLWININFWIWMSIICNVNISKPALRCLVCVKGHHI